MSRNWFLDTNLLANWVMARGGVLAYLQGHLGLPDSLAEAYLARFSEPLRLFDRIDAHATRGGTDQFFVSTLALNELMRAVKHEVVAALAFKEGIPVSMWRDRLNNSPVSEEHAQGIVERVLLGQAALGEHHHIQFISERSPVTDDEYWDLFGSILFLADHAETMDATLATTAVLHGADFFVTQDRRFRTGFNKRFAEVTGMRVVNAQQAGTELRR